MSEPDFMYPGDVVELIEDLVKTAETLAWQHEQFEPDPHRPYDKKAVDHHIDEAKKYRDIESKGEKLLELGNKHPMGLLGVLFDLAKQEQQEHLEMIRRQRMAQEVDHVESGS